MNKEELCRNRGDSNNQEPSDSHLKGSASDEEPKIEPHYSEQDASQESQAREHQETTPRLRKRRVGMFVDNEPETHLKEFQTRLQVNCNVFRFVQKSENWLDLLHERLAGLADLTTTLLNGQDPLFCFRPVQDPLPNLTQQVFEEQCTEITLKFYDQFTAKSTMYKSDTLMKLGIWNEGCDLINASVAEGKLISIYISWNENKDGIVQIAGTNNDVSEMTQFLELNCNDVTETMTVDDKNFRHVCEINIIPKVNTVLHGEVEIKAERNRNDGSGEIIFKGIPQKVQKAKSEMTKELLEVVSKPIQKLGCRQDYLLLALNQEKHESGETLDVKQLIQDELKKHNIFESIQEELGKRNIFVSLQYNSDEICINYCDSVERNKAEKALTEIITERLIEIKETEKELIRTPEWNGLKQVLATTGCVVYENDFESKVYVIGFKSRFEDAFKQVNNYFVENTITTTILQKHSLIVKYLKENIQSEKDFAGKTQGVQLEFVTQENNALVTVKGKKKHITAALEWLRDITSTLTIEKRTFSQPGIPAYFKSQKGLQKIDRISKQHCCVGTVDIENLSITNEQIRVFAKLIGLFMMLSVTWMLVMIFQHGLLILEYGFWKLFWVYLIHGFGFFVIVLWIFDWKAMFRISKHGFLLLALWLAIFKVDIPTKLVYPCGTHVTIFYYALLTVLPTATEVNNYASTQIQSNREILQQQVTVEQGYITTTTCDGIVNTTSNFNLTGEVSNSLVTKVGMKIVHELENSPVSSTDNIRVTKGGNLCKYILHLNTPKDIHKLEDVIVECLREASRLGVECLAIPTIGTGGIGLQSGSVAKCLASAIKNFNKANPDKLKKIQVYVFKSSMLPDFQQELSSLVFPKKAARLEETNTGCQKASIKKTLSIFPLKIYFPKEAPVRIEFCSRFSVNIAKAFDAVQEIIDSGIEKRIESEAIEWLTNEEEHKLLSIAEKENVVFKKTSTRELIIKGVLSNVLEATENSNDIIFPVQQAMQCFENVRWEYLDLKSNQMLPFSPRVNFQLESTRKEAGTNISTTENGVEFKFRIDFTTMEVTNAQTNTTSKLTRTMLDSFTVKWEDMKGEAWKRIVVSDTSSEYQTVLAKFSTSTTSKSLKLERIQNPPFWQQYKSQKQRIELKMQNQSVTRELFHGTACDTCNQICKDSFDRSHAKKDGAFGLGVYFATESQYAEPYSLPDGQGHKQMILAEVVTGKFCKGNSKTVTIPMQNDGSPFDSVVDDTSNPTIFVVFRDASAYPKYILTYT